MNKEKRKLDMLDIKKIFELKKKLFHVKLLQTIGKNEQQMVDIRQVKKIKNAIREILCGRGDKIVVSNYSNVILKQESIFDAPLLNNNSNTINSSEALGGEEINNQEDKK